MRLKKAALLAAIGSILTILAFAVDFFIPSSSTYLMGGAVKAAGSILIVLFFYIFLVKHNEADTLRTAVLVGLIGYMAFIVLTITGMINDCIFYTAVKHSASYSGLMKTALLVRGTNFLTGIIPTALILICLLTAYRSFKQKCHMKNTLLLTLTGQIFSLMVFTVNIFFFKISMLQSIAAFAPSIFITYFFIRLYNVLDNNRNRLLYVLGR